jgi:amino acid transporter
MTASAPRPILRSFDIVSLIVGTVVGAGIYKTPALVAGMVPSDAGLLAFWLLGGMASVLGALCYAELATTFPDAGGEYHFLRLAWGPRLAFLYAWSRATVIVTGSIAMLAIAFGDYISPLLPLGQHSTYWWAAILTVLLSAVNWLGIHHARAAQNLFLGIALVAFVSLVVAGLKAHGMAPTPAPQSAGTSTSAGQLGLAMVFVLLTYGGWNEAAYISAEAQDARRGVVRGLVLGLGAVTLFYIAVNFAYLHGLGREGLAASQTPAADLFRLAFGPGSSAVIAVIVAISCMKSVNATIFFGARSNFALGRDWKTFRWLDGWHESGAPRRAILVQMLVALALIGLASVTRNGFASMVEFTAPVFWAFILLVALAVFRLRARYPDRDRPFRVPGYPVVPALFAGNSAWLLWSSLSYTGLGAAVGVAFLVAGLVPLFLEAKVIR